MRPINANAYHLLFTILARVEHQKQYNRKEHKVTDFHATYILRQHFLHPLH